MVKTENLDILVLGKNIASLIISRLLIQKGKSIRLVDFEEIQDNKSNDSIYPVPITFLRKHSIPYLEMSFKNSTNLSAYIERFITLEKFYFEPLILKDRKSDGQFFNTNEFGIVNSRVFTKFLLKLSSMKNLIILKGEDLQVNRLNNKLIVSIDDLKNYECDNLIISDSLPDEFYDKLEIKIQKSKPLHKFIYKLDIILTDTIEYFFDFRLKCSNISVIPGKNSTFISLYTKSYDNSFDYKEIVSLLLKERYNILDYDIKTVSNSIVYTNIQIQNKHNYPIINNGSVNSLLSQPLLFNPLYISLYSAFKFFSCFINNELNTYYDWYLGLQSFFNKSNNFFYFELQTHDLYIVGKIFSKKYLSQLNIFQKWLIIIRLNSLKTKFDDYSLKDLVKIVNLNFLKQLK